MTKSMAEIADFHIFLPFIKWMQDLHKQSNDCGILTIYNYTKAIRINHNTYMYNK